MRKVAKTGIVVTRQYHEVSIPVSVAKPELIYKLVNTYNRNDVCKSALFTSCVAHPIRFLDENQHLVLYY